MLCPGARISSTGFCEGFCKHVDQQTLFRFGNIKSCVKQDNEVTILFMSNLQLSAFLTKK